MVAKIVRSFDFVSLGASTISNFSAALVDHMPDLIFFLSVASPNFVGIWVVLRCR